MKKLIGAAAMTGALMAAPGLADAAIINATHEGLTFSATFNGNVSGQVVPGLSAYLTFEIIDYDDVANTIVFGVTVDNTSGANFTESRVAAFGFNTDPNVTGGSTVGSSEFTAVVVGSAFPNGFGAIDVCVKGGQANNCQGGTGTGIGINDTPDDFLLTLAFADITPAGVDFSNFGIRWQSLTGSAVIGGQTVNFRGASGTGTSNPVGTPFDVPIPEPTSLALVGVGLLGAGLMRRRR